MLNTVSHFISQHQALAGAVGLWLFSAFAGTMPDPDAASGKGYVWAYRMLHVLAANLDKVRNAVPKA